nr:HEAT repeat domain-containing protein [Paenibacillus xylanexedens]
MSDMNHSKFERLDFDAVNGEEKLQALRNLTELTDSHLTQRVLAIVMNSQEEDLVRIEAWRALGLAGSSELLKEILHAAAKLVRDPDEDEDVQNYALQTLALLPITEAEIQLALEVLQGNAYILVKGAAFAVLAAHQHVSGAKSALESLQSDPDFGTSAKRVLQSNQGSDNL